MKTRVNITVHLTVALVGWAFLLFTDLPAAAATYFIRPDGHDGHDGLAGTPQRAWRSIDRGQPTVLVEDVQAGQRIIRVANAHQFPRAGRVRVGQNIVTCTGRMTDALTGCSGTPVARTGTPVVSLDWHPPQPGDIVVMASGVFFAPSRPGAANDESEFAAVTIRRGGAHGKPIIFRGEGWPVIDGRNEGLAGKIEADHIFLEGIAWRRGGLILRGKGNKVHRCRIGAGNRGIYVTRSQAIEISRNVLYDQKGVGTQPGITLDNVQQGWIHHNTVVSSRAGIRLFGRNSIDIRIENNLVAWCRTGFLADPGATVPAENFHGNLFWKNGQVRMLDPAPSDKSHQHYGGIEFEPQDLHQDPRIVSWEEHSPDFLRPHFTSPCVKNGQAVIGANGPAGYPPSGLQAGENAAFNPSFESGLLGWKIGGQQDLQPGEADWKIVQAGCSEGRRCLEVQAKAKPGRSIQVQVAGSHHRLRRGSPVTLSFRARTEREGTEIFAGVVVPSWQDRSALKRKIRLTREWRTFSVTLTPPPWYPDLYAPEFTISRDRVWLDAVKLEEGRQVTPFSPELELVLPQAPPGLLFLPGKPVELEVLNRGSSELRGELYWRLGSPLSTQEVSGRIPFTSPAQGRGKLPLLLPARLEGFTVLHHEFVVSGRPVARGKMRLAIGTPAPPGRNRTFFAVTPGLAGTLPGEAWEHQCRALRALGLGTLHAYLGSKRMRRPENLRPLVSSARGAGLEWLFTLADKALLTGPQWEAWLEEVTNLARTVKGRVRFWEILNEPNTYLSGEEYLRVLTATAQALRRVDPRTHIVAGSVVNATRGDLWNKTMSVAPGTFDSFSYHPYRFGHPNPESDGSSFRRDLRVALEDLKKHGHPAAVWLTEEGMGPGLDDTRCIGYRLHYDVHPRPIDWTEGEILQAQYLARMYLTALGEGALGYNYHTLQGLARDQEMTPSIGLKAIHTMATLLADVRPLGQLNLGNDFIGYQFSTGPRDTIMAVWMKDAEYGAPVRVRLRLPAGVKVRAVNMLGRALPVRNGRNGHELQAGREVFYMLTGGVSPQEARRAFQQAFSALAVVPLYHVHHARS